MAEQLNHREAVFERLRQALVKIGPIAAQMTFLPGQLDATGKDGLLLAADAHMRELVERWKEIEAGVGAEAEAIVDEYFAGAENMTGEAG